MFFIVYFFHAFRYERLMERYHSLTNRDWPEAGAARVADQPELIQVHNCTAHS